MRTGLIGATALVFALLTVAQSAAAPERLTRPSTPAARDLLAFDREVRTLFPVGHANYGGFCGAHLKQLLVFAARPDFDRLPPDTRRMALRATVNCGEAETREPDVIALVRRLEPLADDKSLVAATNAVLLDADAADGQSTPAARRLITVIDNDPVRVGTWWEPYLTPIITAASRDKTVYNDLLARLDTVAWSEETSARANRNSWALLRADELMAAGNPRGAEAALSRADEVDTLLLVAEDRVYAALWARFQAGGRFDWRAVAERELAARRKISDDNPETLRFALWTQRRLRLLGRYEEAIAHGQTLRGRIAKAETFGDLDAFGGDSLAELASALLDTGRTAEAETVFKEAIALDAKTGGAVARRIEWASRLNGLGRHEEALALLREIKPSDTSALGRQWLWAERVCALSRTKPSMAWTDLPRLLLNKAEGVEPAAKALLCLDRTEEAAALYIERLKDPSLKWDALGAARKVKAPPSVGPFAAELLRRRDAMLARADVRAAIAQAGRSVEVPLTGPIFGWY